MRTVKFTAMADGTKEDYDLLEELEAEYIKELPERILEELAKLKNSLAGYQVDRYEHSLQSATRAYRDGADEEVIVAALLHDLGDTLAPENHSEMAAAIIRPYVSDKTYWIVKTHGIFQMLYYAHHVGGNPNARDRYKDHPYYDDAVKFCEKYDQNSFDPKYDTLKLDFFEPMLRRIFARPSKFSMDESEE
jgi:predicted HD phosphohydrolase